MATLLTQLVFFKKKLNPFPFCLACVKVVMAAVVRHGHVLQAASRRLRNDREVVLAAVHQ